MLQHRIIPVRMTKSKLGPKRIIIFDGDDTLWRTMPLYADAKSRFFQLVARQLPSIENIEAEFEDRDELNVSRWGFTIERFRNSMVETYREFMMRASLSPQLKTEEQISRIATSVLRRKASSMPYAKTILRQLSSKFRLALLTKGEYQLQNRRVAESGLSGFLERVVIVDHKDPATFKRLLSELHSSPRCAWSVGDSLRSDIWPALNAGLNAVWIPRDTWSYENADVPTEGRRFKRIGSIHELASLFAVADGRGGE